MKKVDKRLRNFLLLKSKKSVRHKRKRQKRVYSGKIGVRINRFGDIWESVIAPKNLTLRHEHAEGVLELVQKMKTLGGRRTNIDIRMEEVEYIGDGAVAMLLSVINELVSKGILIKGQKPRDSEQNNVLERSGFFKHMQTNISPSNKNTKNTVLRTGKERASQKKIEPEILKTMETVWGVKARCPVLFGGIGEMLRNSCDHAFSKKENITWHMGITHNDDTKTVSFSFVDNGEGIINNYHKKGILASVSKFFTNNADLLVNAYKNGIESRTGLSWRGKGLPTIYEMYTDKIIECLVIITNDVYIDFEENITKTLSVPFKGTYYFWKVNDKCTPSYFE